MSQERANRRIKPKLEQALRLEQEGKSIAEICQSLKISKEDLEGWRAHSQTHSADTAPPQAPDTQQPRHLASRVVHDRIERLTKECQQLREQLREKEKQLKAAQEKAQREPLKRQRTVSDGDTKVVTEAEPDGPKAMSPETSRKDTAKYEDLTERAQYHRLKEKHSQGKQRFQQAMASELGSKTPNDPPPKSGQPGPNFLNRAGLLLRNKTLPIGIDLEDDSLTLIQLQKRSSGFKLVQAARISGHPDLEPESLGWANWAVDTLKQVTQKSGFKGRKAALALPVRDTYIDHLMISKQKCQDYEGKILEKIGPKLPFDATAENAIVKYISCTDERTLAIVLNRQQVNHYMALCIQARLEPAILSVWPIAMANSFRLICPQHDDSFVMLLDVAMERTNVVICRDASVFYARSIPIGVRDLTIESLITPLAEQINACRKHFRSLYGETISRTIFFASDKADHQTMWKITRGAGLSAQLGNPFEVLKMSSRQTKNSDQHRTGWSIALGLSISGDT